MKWYIYQHTGKRFYISHEIIGANEPMTARSYIIRGLNALDLSLVSVVAIKYIGEYKGVLPKDGYAIYYL